MVASLVSTAMAIGLGWTVPEFAQPQAVDALPYPPGVDPWLFLPVVFLQSILLGSAMGEELGWRGYLLPRLRSRMAARQASLVVGIVWGGWPLPLWLGADANVAPTAAFLAILADAVLFTWLQPDWRESRPGPRLPRVHRRHRTLSRLGRARDPVPTRRLNR